MSRSPSFWSILANVLLAGTGVALLTRGVVLNELWPSSVGGFCNLTWFSWRIHDGLTRVRLVATAERHP